MSCSVAIHIVSPTEFDTGAAQTPGSERRAAIAPTSVSPRPSGAACSRWNRDRGPAFIIMESRRRSPTSFPASPKYAGEKKENQSRARRQAISFTFPPSCRTWKSILRSRSHFGGSSCEAPRHLLWSTFRTTPGRKPGAFLQAAFTDYANMEQSWPSTKPIPSLMHLR